MKSYLELVYEELRNISKVTEKPDVYGRIVDLKDNYIKMRKILEMAERVSTHNDIPYQLKYWFWAYKLDWNKNYW